MPLICLVSSFLGHVLFDPWNLLARKVSTGSHSVFHLFCLLTCLFVNLDHIFNMVY